MTLNLIHGPPNSGRTDLVLDRFLAERGTRPVLVASGGDDVFRWQERLLARRRELGRGAILGSSVVNFDQLCAETLELAGEPALPPASELTRRRLMSKALAGAGPGPLAEAARRQHGVVESLLELADDFRLNLKDPYTLERSVEGSEHRAYLAGLIAVFAAYERELEGAGTTDTQGANLAACRADPRSWSGRAVYLAGFDDLSPLALELIARISSVTELTIAFTHEAGRAALGLTATTYAQLSELGGREIPPQLPPGDDRPANLRAVAERFMREDAGAGLAPDDSIGVIRSAGSRGEAEAVGARVARLIAGGADPDRIAVAVPSPEANGPLIREVLESYGVRASVEGAVPPGATAVGSALMALLRAAGPGGGAADLVLFMRGPSGVAPEVVDRVERIVLRNRLRTAPEAARVHSREAGGQLAAWRALRADGPLEALAAEIEELACRMAERAGGGTLPAAAGVEGRMAAAVCSACRELCRHAGSRERLLAQLREALESGAVTARSTPVSGTVRIASPYGMRAKRLEHLILASAQESGLAGEPRSPYLTEAQRRDLGMSQPLDADLIDRYLFLTCLAVPTRSLRISYRSSDELGKPAFPSPLVAELEALFGGEGSLTRVAEGRPAGAAVFAASDAPSREELARSLAAASDDSASAVDDPALTRRVEAAREAESDARRLAPLADPEVLAAIAERPEVSATTVEDFTRCPYRWLLWRELRPRPITPDPPYLTVGNLMHEALRAAYSAHPGELPRPETREAWLAVAEEAMRTHVEDPRNGVEADAPETEVMLARARHQLGVYLEAESQRESPRFLPAEIEARFSDAEGADHPAVPMGASSATGRWRMSGAVDRLDLGAEGAVVLDYKTGSSDDLRLKRILETGRLQLQLYLHAVRETLGRPPAAGLYVPISLGGLKPRGMISAESAAELADLGPTRTDQVEDLEALVASAVEQADGAVDLMRTGAIAHDPRTCPDHLEHPLVREVLIDEDDDA